MEKQTKGTALIAMGAKPFSAGHAKLIELASQEQEHVQVYTSLAPRGSIDNEELEITSMVLGKMWATYILSKLPSNVTVFFVDNPISAIYEELSQHVVGLTYHIYGGTEALQKSFQDIEKYSTFKINSELFLHGVNRDKMHKISGTELRRALFKKNREVFYGGVPNFVDKNAYWQFFLNLSPAPNKLLFKP